MPNPIGVLTATTATGDVVTGPGCATVICKGKPASCVCDAVTGAVCVGVVSKPGKTTIILKAMPVAAVLSTVTGVNPVTGIPVSTMVLSPLAPTITV